MKRSVAVTACNSAAFITEQMDSVLCQLAPADEVVISIDPSTDETVQLLTAYAKRDRRIHLLPGPGKGLIANFENAISNCNGELIFLCDHDDVWLPGKMERMTACFADPTVMVAMHDAKVCDHALHVVQGSYMRWHGSRAGYWPNIVRNSFIGCCMAFRSSLKAFILPFPSDLPMHDQWIGLLGYRHGAVWFVDEPLLLYRRHGANMSSTAHAGCFQMLRWRMQLLKNLSKRK